MIRWSSDARKKVAIQENFQEQSAFVCLYKRTIEADMEPEAATGAAEITLLAADMFDLLVKLLVGSIIGGISVWLFRDSVERRRQRRNIIHAVILDIEPRREQYRRLYLSLTRWIKDNIEGDIDIDASAFKVSGEPVRLLDRIHYERQPSKIFGAIIPDMIDLLTKDEITAALAINRRFELVDIYMTKLELEIARYRESVKENHGTLSDDVSIKLMKRLSKTFEGFEKLERDFNLAIENSSTFRVIGGHPKDPRFPSISWLRSRKRTH